MNSSAKQDDVPRTISNENANNTLIPFHPDSLFAHLSWPATSGDFFPLASQCPTAWHQLPPLSGPRPDLRTILEEAMRIVSEDSDDDHIHDDDEDEDEYDEPMPDDELYCTSTVGALPSAPSTSHFLAQPTTRSQTTRSRGESRQRRKCRPRQ